MAAARTSKLIAYIMHWNRITREDAEAWADRHCGDWRNTPLPRAKRCVVEKRKDDEE